MVLELEEKDYILSYKYIRVPAITMKRHVLVLRTMLTCSIRRLNLYNFKETQFVVTYFDIKFDQN